MGSILRFAILITVKLVVRCLYAFEVKWVGRTTHPHFKQVRLGVFLNHTSLFDILFLATAPPSILWKIARHGIYPVADITMSRPLVGRLLKLVAPQVVTISRKRDETWNNFLRAIDADSLILIAAEGRMKRPNGLDKHGKPMSVRGGIADVLQALDSGNMVLCYSAGIHHVQAPGEGIPKIFKRVRIAFESVSIREYKQTMGPMEDFEAWRLRIIADLESRKARYCL